GAAGMPASRPASPWSRSAVPASKWPIAMASARFWPVTVSSMVTWASGLWCVSFMSRFSLGVDGVGVFVLVDGLGGFLVVLLGVGGGEFGPSGVFVGAHAAAAVVGGAGDGVAVADE